VKRILAVFLILATAAGSWYLWHTSRVAHNNTPPTFHGNVDIREVRLGFRIGGKVRDVLKEEGDEVRAGDVVARLDAEPFQNAVDQAEAETRVIEARLTELRNGARPEDIEQARKNLAATEAAYENARLIFERQSRLVASGAVARQDFDTARSTFEAARARWGSAKAALDLLLAGTRAEQIRQAEASLEAARAALSQARTQLADTQLTAPEAGIALTRVVEPGSIVQAGSTALTVSLVSPVRVRAYAPEPQLGLVHPGRKVLVFTDSRPEPYQGRIGDVSPRAEFTPKSVETEELRTALVYRFRVVVLDADQGLRQGMPVTVKLAD
jgi:HlyD family secretion protein